MPRALLRLSWAVGSVHLSRCFRFAVDLWRCGEADYSRVGAAARFNFIAGRVEDGRGSLGHLATLRFPSPLIEPDVPISGIRLSDWLHREVHGEQTNRTRLRHGE